MTEERKEHGRASVALLRHRFAVGAGEAPPVWLAVKSCDEHMISWGLQGKPVEREREARGIT